jgi:hypothetical protein
MILIAALLFSLAGLTTASNPLRVDVKRTVAVAGGDVPLIFRIDAENLSHVRTEVLDAHGRRIAALRPISNHLWMWDTRDDAGRAVTPGTYSVEVIAEPYLWNGAVTVTQ